MLQVAIAKEEKEREKRRREFEDERRKLKEHAEKGVVTLTEQFSTTDNREEQEFKQQTVGFSTLEDYKAKREEIELRRKALEEAKVRAIKRKRKEKRKEKHKKISQLTFSFEDGEEEEFPVIEKKKKLGKNPHVDTSFLPDRHRDEVLKKEQVKLQEDWKLQQSLVKKELLEITFSYWDGSGHRRTTQVEKGCMVGEFLDQAREELVEQFPELKSFATDQLMYIKEDLVVPHSYSFYDLIISKARGRTGPLFRFDVSDQVRVVTDRRVDKEESHPGKVVTREWFERNKHIYPANRWEVYDPNTQAEMASGDHSRQEHDKLIQTLVS